MAKKYSVNMENDEVISVEVDGVRYATPEDVPNKNDREKIHRLISRLAGGGADDEARDEVDGFAESFDLEFEADLRGLGRNATQGTKLFMMIFIGVAAIVLTVAAFSALHALRTQAREEEARGEVVDLVVRQSRDSDTQEIIAYTYPVVEFAMPGKPPQRVQMSEGSSPPAYAVGEEVTVLYDPQQPGSARIKSFSSTLLLWLVPAITTVVGVSFVLAAILAVRMGGTESQWPDR